MEQMDREAGGELKQLAPAEGAARLAQAETLVKDHVLMSLAPGIIPVPGLDIAGGIAIQFTLLKRLCTLYGVPFSENVARGAVMSALGVIGAVGVAVGLFFSGVKLLPGAGTLFGIVSLPIAIGAVTYALGKLFVAHLELGGVLLDFRPASSRAYLKDMVRRGHQAAADLLAPAAREVAQA